MENIYSVYIELNDSNYIIAVNSDGFVRDLTGWIKIDEGRGDRYYHAQGNYFNKPIMTEFGVYRYQYVDSAIKELTNEEIAELEAAIVNSQLSTPSQLDRIEAQIAYTAMMTDTLLEAE